MIQNTSVSASDSINLSVSISASVKSALSISHYEAAKHFSTIAEQIEREQIAFPYPQSRISELKSYSIAATILSVAGVEAKINEMFLHVVDNTLPPMNGSSFEKKEILKEVWKDIEKITTLRKYQIFLLAADSHSFDISAEPYQSMSLLIRLRNALIHFKPEWDDEDAEHKKLQNQLSNKFQINALENSAVGNKAWFPRLCMGSGCANWAVATSKEFLKVFHDNLQITHNPYI